MKRINFHKTNTLQERFFCLASAMGVLLIFSACRSEEAETEGEYISTPPPTQWEWDTALEGTVDIQGQVTDYLGEPIGSATVAVGDDEMETTSDGMFALGKVATGDVVVNVSHSNYIPAAVTIHVTQDSAHSLVVPLIPLGERTELNASVGGTAMGVRGAEATFPINAFVDGKGSSNQISAEVAVTPIDPSRTEEVSAVPGDFSAIVDGNNVKLESFGMLDVRVPTHSVTATTPRLAPGVTVQVKIPVAAACQDTPASLPLWYFDEFTAQWKAEGTAELSADGKTYMASISKLGLWNLDDTYELTCITGRLMDSSNNALADKPMDVIGVSYFSRTTARTDIDGRFFVPAKIDSDIVVKANAWFSEGWPPALAFLRSQELRVHTGTALLSVSGSMDEITCMDVGEIVANVLPYDGIVINEDFTILDERDVDALQSIEKIEGSLVIKDTSLDEITLPNLREAGELQVKSNRRLTILSMPKLQSVGILNLQGNELLSDLSGLASLVRVGQLKITGVTEFSDLRDLSSLRDVMSLYIDCSGKLDTLAGLEKIEELSILSIFSNWDLETLTGLDNLRIVSDQVSISHNMELRNVNGLNRLENIGLELAISHNGSLESLDGLNNLKRIGALSNDYISAFFAIYSNSSLPSCDANRILSGITFDQPERSEVCIYNNASDTCEEFPCDHPWD